MAKGGINVPISATWNGRALKQAEGQMSGFKKSFGKAFLGLGAAAGAAIGISALADSMKAAAMNAAEDQKSMATLGKTMANLGFEGAQKQSEAFISSLSLQTGVVDDDLRPAFDRLLRSTGSVEEAQRALVIANDAAASSGRNVKDVSMLLGKAYDGNTMALARAGFGIDTNILKTKDMTKITAELARITGGQAAVAADTYAGKLQRLDVAGSEASETIGYELLRSADNLASSFGGTDGFVTMIGEAADKAADFTAGIGLAAKAMNDWTLASVTGQKGAEDTALGFGDLLNAINKLNPFTGQMIMLWDKVTDAGKQERDAQSALTDEVQRATLMRHAYNGSLNATALAERDATDQAVKAKSAVDRLRDSLDRMNGKNISVVRARIGLKRTIAEGPQGTGRMVGPEGKQHATVTRDDRLLWAADTAEQAMALAEAQAAKHKAGRKDGWLARSRKTLDSTRGILAGTVGKDMAANMLSTPQTRSASTPSTTNTYEVTVYQTGVSIPDAVKAAKDAARLNALSRGAVPAVDNALPANNTWAGHIQ